MEIVALFAGLCLLALGTLVILTEARMRRGAIEVPARLIGFSASSGASGGVVFHAVAQYDGLDGETRYLTSSVGSSSPIGQVGDDLPVLVHADDPEKAAIRSALTYVLGAVIAAMGVGSCIVFFAVFRITPFSLAAAAAVTGWGAWKFHNSPLRDRILSPQAWLDYDRRQLRARIFTEATKREIKWADPAALQRGVRDRQRTRRFAIPVLLLAGTALMAAGLHLHEKTASFLATAVRGTGVVVGLQPSHSSDGTTWAPVVEFEHDGRKFRFRDSVSSNPPSWRTGDAVSVLYDPFHPADARIDRGWWNEGIAILVGAFGALFCSLGLWIALRRTRAPALAPVEGR